jgi:hypothetical protein
MIVGVSDVAYVHLPSNEGTTAKRLVSLKDLRYYRLCESSFLVSLF